MKRYLGAAQAALAVALAFAAPPAALAQTKFEGAVTFRMLDDDGETSELVQTTKGRKTRIDGMGSEAGSAWIIDNEQKRFVIIDPSDKEAMVMTEQDMEQTRALTEAALKGHRDASKKGQTDSDYQINFANTGRTETVAGVECEVWKGHTIDEGKKEEGEVCLGNGVGFAPFETFANNPFLGGESEVSKQYAQYEKLVGPNKGILKFTEITGGKRTVRVEATKVDRKPVSDASFEPPPGYKVVNMGEMLQEQMKMMQQMQQQKPQKPQN
jgi:hypothetical protein